MEALDRETHQSLHIKATVSQRPHLPGHHKQAQHNTRPITLNEKLSHYQKETTGSRSPLDPPKNSDPRQERRTPSKMIGPPKYL